MSCRPLPVVCPFPEPSLLRVGCRVLRIAVAGLAVAVLSALDCLHMGESSCAAVVGRRCRRAAERLGPTFVKAAQLISSSPGSLPKGFVEELAHCRDDVAPAPWNSVAAVIDEDLGERARHLVGLEREALAAGSMAEVHGAVLRDGTRVVVKVQRPGLPDVLAQDLAVLRLMARVLVRCSRRLRAANPLGVVEDFATGLSDQLSFRSELDNLKRMRVSLSALPVRLPRPWPSLCTERVLVMERLDGMSLSDFAASEAQDAQRRVLVTTIVDSLLVPSLAGAVFHGDAHAGNMLVLRDGRLALLDFGLVGRLAPPLAERLGDTLAAIAGGRTAEAALGIFSLADAECSDMAGFAGELQSFVATSLDRSLRELNVARVLSELLSLAARSRLGLPKELVAFFKQLVYLDAICRDLDPTFELLHDGGRLIDSARERAGACWVSSARDPATVGVGGGGEHG